MRTDLFFSWQALKTYINVGLHISADQVKKKKKKRHSKGYVRIYHNLKATRHPPFCIDTIKPRQVNLERHVNCHSPLFSSRLFVLGIRNPRGNTLNHSDLGTGYQKHRDSKTTGKPKTRRYSKYADTQNTEILKTWGVPKTQGYQHHRCDCDGGKTLEVINQRTGD